MVRSVFTNSLMSGLLVFLLFSCKETTTPPPPTIQIDTTSHDFTWQVSSFGDLTSTLRDVIAISENNIWAVGQIYKNDTTFNALHWNGQRWETHAILFNTLTGNRSPSRIEAVFAFSEDDVWMFSVVGSYAHWDGRNWESHLVYETKGSIRRIWGSQNDRVFFVGSNGNITKFGETGWQLVNNQISENLKDIAGFIGHEDLWVCGYASNYSSSILLHFDGSEWQTNWRLTPEAFAVSTYEGLLQSLCALGEDSLIVVGGDGVFRQDRIGNSPPKRDNINLNAFPQSIRGNAPNNLFIVGFNGMVWHFNGRSWHFFNNLHNPNWTFESVSVLGNFVVAVGEDASEGISKDLVLIGHRN